MTGVTNAFLNADGKRPTASDRLNNSSVRNGEMSVATCLSSGTDNGSAAELLSGSFMIPAVQYSVRFLSPGSAETDSE